MYVLNVQIVWIESKKVIEYKGNIRTFLAEDLLRILLCGISERVFLFTKPSGVIKTWVIRNENACSALEYRASNHSFFNTKCYSKPTVHGLKKKKIN